MPLLLLRNDITNVHADAIVNPANPELAQGSGTSRAIYLAAGEAQLTKACADIGHCDLGKAVLTPAFHLAAKYIIHAVCPQWTGGQRGEEQLLYDTYREAMLLAKEKHLESIAFPLLSAGNYCFPKDVAMKTAVHAISDFLMEHEMTVYLVLYDSTSISVSKKLFASVEEYIDDHYVQKKDESFPTTSRRLDIPDFQMLNCPTLSPSQSLDERMHHMEETFSQKLLRLIDEKGLSDASVYKKANIDRRHFSKIRNDAQYCPSKKTALAFAIALELTFEETEALLKSAGYAFSYSSKFDVIISYFIENRKYDIFEINEVLFCYGQAILGG